MQKKGRQPNTERHRQIYRLLKTYPGGMTQYEISRVLGLNPSSVESSVMSMENNGFYLSENKGMLFAFRSDHEV